MTKVFREPSIHIGREKFKAILHDELKFWPRSIDDLVDSIFAKASKHALTHRKLLASTGKQRKTASRLVASTLADTREFAQLLTLIRRAHHHKGIATIKESSKDWLVLKEVAQLALSFANDFELHKGIAYKQYITIALSKMKNFSLVKFNSLHQAICQEYQAIEEIQKDETPLRTQQVALYFNKVIAEKTGQNFDYRKLPEKYKYFIYVKRECDSRRVTIEDYINAQFAAFDWRSAIPEVSQLVGDKAIERLNKFLYKNGITITKPTTKIDFSKIRDHESAD